MNRDSFEVFRSRTRSRTQSVQRSRWRPEIEILEQRIVPATPASFESASGIAAKFGTYEVLLTGNGSVSNPFATKGSVTFTSPSNQLVTVNDFYDGGNIWRARVYVTETGVWNWSSASLDDPGLNGASGTFTASDTGLPGLLKQNPNNAKAWITSRGQWFNYVGDAAWVLFNQSPTFSPNYQAFVNDAATQGINTLGPVGMLGAWGSTNPSVSGLGNNDPWVSGDNTRYDLSKYQTTDTRLEWIFNAHPDMYVQGQFIGTEWQYNNSWINLPQSVRNNTLDYMIARWGAFPNMIWLVSEDQYTGQSSTQAFNRDVGPYLAAHQPWKHLLSTQSINENFNFTTASDLNWVDYIPLQAGTDPVPLGADQVQNFAGIPRAVMMSEDWYEQDDFWHPELSDSSDINFYVRWDFWSWTLAGGSANYGARPFAADPYSQTGTDTYKEPISPHTDFSGRALHGLDSIPNLSSYFQSRHINLSLFTPNDSLVTSWSMASGDSWHPNLTQRGTSEFLVYDPNAGSEGHSAHLDSARTASVTIDMSSASGTYEVEWYRPSDGAVQRAANVSGGGLRTFTAPWTGTDVVLRVLRMPTLSYNSSTHTIYVTGPGWLDLTTIQAKLPSAPLTLVDATNHIWLLSANLKLRNGAELDLHGTAVSGDVDELRLMSNNNPGATFNNVRLTAEWGDIDVKGTKITSWDTAANGVDTEYASLGRASITAASFLDTDGVTPLESRMDIADSDIGYLGYNGGETNGLTWKARASGADVHYNLHVYGAVINSHIHDSYYGVYTVGGYQMQVRNSVIDRNASYAVRLTDGDDNLFQGNQFANNATTIWLERGRRNRFDSNTIPSDVIVYTKGSSAFPGLTLVSNQPLLRVKVDAYSSVVFQDAAGKAFDTGTLALSTTVTTAGSSLTLTQALIGANSLLVTTRNLAVTVDSGTALIDPTVWHTSVDYLKKWTMQAGSATQSASYTVGDLLPNTSYKVKKAGVLLFKVISDANGVIQFADVAGTLNAVDYVIIAG